VPGFLFLGKAGRWPPRGAASWRHGRASPNLQSVVRALLLRPVAENGSEAAARVLRELADELEGLPVMYAVRTRPAHDTAGEARLGSSEGWNGPRWCGTPVPGAGITLPLGSVSGGRPHLGRPQAQANACPAAT